MHEDNVLTVAKYTAKGLTKAHIDDFYTNNDKNQNKLNSKVTATFIDEDEGHRVLHSIA